MQINLFSGSLPLLLTATTDQIWYILIGSFGQKKSPFFPSHLPCVFCCSALFCYDNVAIPCRACSIM